jgi:hypothetical protein
MDHVTTPPGAEAFAEPVSVAVKVIAPPRVGVELEVSAAIGVASATVVAVAELVVETEK